MRPNPTELGVGLPTDWLKNAGDVHRVWGIGAVIETVVSKHGVSIRLTDERWAHITEEHCELASLKLDVLEAVANPQRILEGHGQELFAVREIEPGKYLVVVYRDLANDGFIITAFVTRRRAQLDRRKQIWP